MPMLHDHFHKLVPDNFSNIEIFDLQFMAQFIDFLVKGWIGKMHHRVV